jgi:hypothetical protein
MNIKVNHVSVDKEILSVGRINFSVYTELTLR